MAGKTEKITTGETPQAATILCQKTIAASDGIVICPRAAAYSTDCWKAKGGCGRAGCPGLPKLCWETGRKGDPPPPVSKKVIIGSVLAVAL